MRRWITVRNDAQSEQSEERARRALRDRGTCPAAKPPRFIHRDTPEPFGAVGADWDIEDTLEKMEKMRGYKVDKVAGCGDDWRVTFYIDQEEVGHACLQTSEQADDVGVDFMFGDTP